MKLDKKEVKRVGLVIAIIVSCVAISWTSVYFLGDDNIIEHEIEGVEINIMETELHLSHEEAEKDASIINPRIAGKNHN